MSALIFLLLGAAMTCVFFNSRNRALILFSLGLGLSMFWLHHHMPDPLELAF